MRLDKTLVDHVPFNQQTLSGLQKCHIAAGIDREKPVANLAAPQSRFGRRGNPIPIESRFDERIDRIHPRAVLFRLVQVFHGHGLIIGRIRAENTTMSAPYQSLYEHVDAATPIVRFMAAVEGLWQRRAALSTCGEP